MTWQDILKNEDRQDLERKLEQLLREKFEYMDENNWAEYSPSNSGPSIDGIEVNVFFEDYYEGEEDLDDVEKFEEGEGHFRIDFTSSQLEEFAMSDYTSEDGYSLHEFNPEKLEINDLKAAIKGLTRFS